MTLTLKHIFKQGSDPSQPLLLLLHGTGGTENDLIPLAERLAPTASVLGVRGAVLENGMPRFFRRLAEGVFDEPDLIARTHELNTFLDEAAVEYGFDRRNIVAVGYSNGANIAASLLFHDNQSLKGAVLHHAMVPLRSVTVPDLSGIPIFMGSGTNDPIIPRAETEELAKYFVDAQANLHLHWENYGHQLTATEVEAAVQWYNQQFTS